MINVKDIKHIHIELTDKCQAQCPMCARNYHGGKTRPFIRNGDISIDQFKTWFSVEFLKQITNFYSCGNYGDPAFAKDCLEIYTYVRQHNPHTRLAIHTNGGMRNQDWWSKLAKQDVEVIFAVDGFKGKHELYRKNTNFDKVIENLTAFIDAGGSARVDSLVFKHNEHEVNELEKFLLSLGAKEVNFVSTTRFYEMEKFEVHDLEGNIEYYLEPAQTLRFKKEPNSTLTSLLDTATLKTALHNANIIPQCETVQEVYVDPYGNIFPCCFVGGDYLEHPVPETLPIHILRNLSVKQTQNIMNLVGIPNCSTGVLSSEEILFKKLNDYWEGQNKCMTCAKVCSKMLYDKRK